jgi:hypothetical protein
VLEFLVTSTTRRRLLLLLWAHDHVGTVPELAREADVPVPGAYAELRAMKRLGLATAERRGTFTAYRANKQHPQAEHLLALLRPPLAAVADPGDHEVQLQLRDLGAPLAVAGEPAERPAPEQVLVEGVKLAHRDPAVAKTLPVCLWRNRDKLDPVRLRAGARAAGEKHALGFFLELTTTLSGDKRFARWSRHLRDRRVRRRHDFFDLPGSRAWKALADRNAPAAAHHWNYRMNMDEETFRSHFRKFVDEEISA